MIAVYAGTSDRVTVDESAVHTPTLVFKAPDFNHFDEELEVRRWLAAKYAERSLYARARLRALYHCRRGLIAASTRDLLNAFNAQALEKGAAP